MAKGKVVQVCLHAEQAHSTLKIHADAVFVPVPRICEGSI